MTYPEAVEFLYSLRWFGAKFGLENTRRLAELAGNPQDRLRFIHVAGTNGKGSTCAMLESIYRQAGLRVGLFTSPHLVSFAERIQVNRALIAEADIVRLVREVQPLLGQFPADHHPTFFEVVTVMALKYFAEQRCDLVAWETGLGGRLDATNIVTPIASVITNIQYDHQKWLGHTLAAIAAEKAGIIKPGVSATTGADAPEALGVIRETARSRNAPLREVSATDLRREPLHSLRLPLAGDHQRLNAAVALATVEILQDSIPVTASQIRAGLERVYWPGRLQLFTRPDGQRLLLDGAHNPAGVEALAASLRLHFPDARATLVLGMLEDKDWPAMCAQLAPLAARILLTPVHSERSAAPHGLAKACAQANPKAEIVETPSLRAALDQAQGDPFVVIAGSLYLVGEAMELLGLSPCPATGERGLNEWTAEPNNPIKLR